jgi:hypothetical protein
MLGKPFNQKADVYSFGMTLWEIVTCKELFPHHRSAPSSCVSCVVSCGLY